MRETVKDADVIVPLAALVGAPVCKRDPLTAQSVNTDAVRMLLELRSPSQLIVFPNTNSGYGTQTGEVFCTEDTPLEPITPVRPHQGGGREGRAGRAQYGRLPAGDGLRLVAAHAH